MFCVCRRACSSRVSSSRKSSSAARRLNSESVLCVCMFF